MLYFGNGSRHVVHRAVAAWQKWLLWEQALRTTLPLSSWNVAVTGPYGSVGDVVVEMKFGGLICFDPLI